MEGGAAEKFAEKRGGGDLVGGDGLEAAEQPQQTVGRGIFLKVFRYLA